MNKEIAAEINKLTLEAIEKLVAILYVDNRYDSYEHVKKGVGLSIGRIQTDILELLYKEHPDLDPDKEMLDQVQEDKK